MMNKQELIAFMGAIIKKYKYLELKQLYCFKTEFGKHDGETIKWNESKEGIEFCYIDCDNDFDSFESDVEQLLNELDICLPPNSLFRHSIELLDERYVVYISIYTKNDD